MNYQYKDCYVRCENAKLTVGNGRIERAFLVDRYGLTPLSVSDRAGTVWAREEGVRRLNLPFESAEPEIAAREDDHCGLSERFMAVDLTWRGKNGETLVRTITIFPDTPFISMEMCVENIGVYRTDAAEAIRGGDENGAAAAKKAAWPDSIDAFPLPRGHYKLHVTQLLDKSDLNDALVRSYTRQVYAGGWGGEWDEGSAFVLDDYVHGRALMLVKDAPYPMSALHRTAQDLFIQRGECALLVGSGLDGVSEAGALYGYGSTVGVGTRDELDRLYRAYYKRAWKRDGGARVMSNTWGDRSRDAAVCHDFMMKEIDRAAYLGVDIVQIDDGWQRGHTTNSALKKGGVWEGYYSADPRFWAVNEEKFPHGLKPLVDKARGYGIELGLWFSPDSTDDFARWRRDADTLLGLWRQEGVRHFKLDGVNIRSKRGEANYLRLLEAVTAESGGAISVNQDVTAQVRLGALYFKQYGNLFVENRYTDTCAYYPHATLKNVWTLSRLLPPGKLQFEALNPRRNTQLYAPGDEFAPDYYDMDYLFAAVMTASPLIWMEMSHLNEEDSRRLKAIIAVYRAHRDDFASGDIAPIGEEPDGQSLTGFKIDCGGRGYLLLFRESTDRDAFALPEELVGARMSLLCSNADIELNADGVRLGKRRAYALIEWTKGGQEKCSE